MAEAQQLHESSKQAQEKDFVNHREVLHRNRVLPLCTAACQLCQMRKSALTCTNELPAPFPLKQPEPKSILFLFFFLNHITLIND